MNIEDKWDEAAATGEPVDIGDTVICDICDKDYTDSLEPGGFIFTSSAYCPVCAVKQLPVIEGYNEQKYIRAKCPQFQSFADFVREYRGGNNKISIRNIIV